MSAAAAPLAFSQKLPAQSASARQSAWLASLGPQVPMPSASTASQLRSSAQGTVAEQVFPAESFCWQMRPAAASPQKLPSSHSAEASPQSLPAFTSVGSAQTPAALPALMTQRRPSVVSQSTLRSHDEP